MTDPVRFDTFLQVRLTTHDKERIKARAKASGENTSAYVRKRALGDYGIWGDVELREKGLLEIHTHGRPSKTAQAPRSDP